MILSGISFFLVYTITGFLAIPFGLKYLLENRVAEQIDRTVNVEKIRFNPLNLQLNVTDFNIKEKTGNNNLAGFKGLYVDFDISSIFKRALIISEIRLDGAELQIVRQEDTSWNFHDIVQQFEQDEKKGKEASDGFRFSINNILISDGSINFMDVPEETAHFAEKINIAVPFISNFPHTANIFVTPRFSAVINNSPVEFKGSTKPFTPERNTSINLDITGLELKHYFKYMSNLVDLNLESGSLDANASISFMTPRGGEPYVEVAGKSSIKNFKVTDRSGKPIAEFKKLAVMFAPSDLIHHLLNITDITLDKPEFHLVRSRDGKMNISSLLSRRESGGTHRKEEKTTGTINIKKFSTADGSVFFTDHLPGGGYSMHARDINMLVRDISTSNRTEASYSIDLKAGIDEQLKAKGVFTWSDQKTFGVISLKNFEIEPFAPYISSFFTGHVSGGKVDVNTEYYVNINDAPEIKARNADMVISGLKIGLNDKSEVMSAEKIRLVNGNLNMQTKEFSADAFHIKGGQCRIERKADNSLNLARMLPQKKSMTAEDHGETAKKEMHGTSPGAWKLALGELDVDNYGINFMDRAAGDPLTTSMYPLSLKLVDISNDPNQVSSFKVRTGINGSGRLEFKGKGKLLKKEASMHVALHAIPIRDFQEYIPFAENLSIKGGRLYVTGDLALSDPGMENPSISFRGDADLNRLDANDIFTGKRVLSYRKFSARGINVYTRKRRYLISRIGVEDFFGNIEVMPDGMLNIQRLFNWQGTGAAKKTKKSADHPMLKVRAALLKNGSFKFTDSSIFPPFSTTVSDINGTLTGLSTDPESKAAIKLDAVANSAAAIKIEGKANILAKKISGEIEVTAQDVSMTRFSTYAERYLGYMIQKGKLDLHMKYFIADNKLSAENKIFLNHFTLGDTVESTDAINLPVGIAVALLKDRNGDIHLDLPVSGDLNDPDFSIASAAWTMVLNLITKAATSPFALLNAVLGEDQDISRIEFDPGSAVISRATEEKVAALAHVLRQRPAIHIELQGLWHSDIDTEPMVEDRFQEMLRAAKFEDMSREERKRLTVDDIRIQPEEYREYLTDVYEDAPFDKPRNFIGLIKSQPVDVMEKMVRKNIKVTTDELRQLALDRSENVKVWLVKRGGIDASRIFVVQPENGDDIDPSDKNTGVLVSIKGHLE